MKIQQMVEELSTTTILLFAATVLIYSTSSANHASYLQIWPHDMADIFGGKFAYFESEKSVL